MTNKIEVLKVRVLCSFRSLPEEMRTVTQLTKVLQEEKYAVSRALTALETDGFINKLNPRKPQLTMVGELYADRLNEKISTATNRLLREGIEERQAKEDAIQIVIHCSDDTWRLICEKEILYDFKGKQKDGTCFGGERLARELVKLNIAASFVVNQKVVTNGNTISIANESFEHPGKLIIKDGKGELLLRTKGIKKYDSAEDCKLMGKMESLEYETMEGYIPIESRGAMYAIPLNAFRFQIVGEGRYTILHGSVGIRTKVAVEKRGSMEKEAILTLML